MNKIEGQSSLTLTPEVRDISADIAELELASRQYFVIGGTALRLHGYDVQASRTEVVMTDSGYRQTQRRLQEVGIEEQVVDPDVMGWRSILEVPVGTLDNRRPLEIMRWWHPRNEKLLTEPLTYVRYAHRATEVDGIPAVDSVTSLRWLLERGKQEDRSVVFGALRTVLNARPAPRVAAQLAEAATAIWPKRGRTAAEHAS